MEDNKSNEIENAAGNLIIEDAFARLDEINAKLESQDTSLKEALELYAEGVKLAAACRENLEGVEKEIKILNEV
jgi:exodeoxyribonuclease VII small subunit